MKTLTVLLCVLLYLCTGTEGVAAASLINRSPFLPPGSKKLQTPKPKTNIPQLSAEFEFLGVMHIGDLHHFNLRDKRSGESLWLQPGEVHNGFRIQSYNTEQKEITYSWNGRSGTVRLLQSVHAPVTFLLNDKSPRQGINNQSSATNSSRDTQSLTPKDKNYNFSGLYENQQASGEKNSTRTGARPNSLNRGTVSYLMEGRNQVSSFAQTESTTEQVDTPNTGKPRSMQSRYTGHQIRRVPKIENPTGKLPDHLR
jgi:hypothetical protein